MYLAITLLPLFGAVINGLVLLPSKASTKISHIVGVLPIASSFVLAIIAFSSFMSAGGTAQTVVIYQWLAVDNLSVPLALLIDRLSMLMLLIVTGIGTLIHLFAGGYLHEEQSTARFFSYLNLFVFMMLLLILSDNLLVMFIGWEGVGLCSYLLIGYWFTEDNNAKAGMKAFIVNRIGDVGFLVAIFLTFQTFNTLAFPELRQLIASTTVDSQTIFLITLCLFIGACGKSAQLPLHVWLPDAMAGPTPVSALIHAATMVTAGIFMLSRLSFMFVLAPMTMQIIAIVGAVTALLAATIAITQNDIKKVLAYSTVSQLGYMIMACGVGAFGAGVFHLMTHACFKALLFLGAGSVIVALHHQQDLAKMGGLWSKMRITAGCFLVGVLAIAGVPGLAGFFSKDEILFLTYSHGGPLLWAIAAFTALLTAFYMTRLFCLAFLGTPRFKTKVQETSAVMWLPLVILAILSVVSGWLGIPEVLGGNNLLHHYLEPVLVSVAHPDTHRLEIILMSLTTAMMFLAMFVAYFLYRNGHGFLTLALTAGPLNPLYRLSFHKYWLDELYLSLFVKPGHRLALFIHKIIDSKIIDGFVNGLGQRLLAIATTTSNGMTGNVHRHALVFLLGLAGGALLLFF